MKVEGEFSLASVAAADVDLEKHIAALLTKAKIDPDGTLKWTVGANLEQLKQACTELGEGLTYFSAIGTLAASTSKAHICFKRFLF